MKLDNPQQYVGKKYSKTTIVKYIGRYYSDHSYKYECICDCGKEFTIRLRKKDKVRTCCSSCLAKLNRPSEIPARFDYYGEKIYLKDLAEKLNINYHTLRYRIYTLKWNKDKWKEPVKRKHLV